MAGHPEVGPHLVNADSRARNRAANASDGLRRRAEREHVVRCQGQRSDEADCLPPTLLIPRHTDRIPVCQRRMPRGGDPLRDETGVEAWFVRAHILQECAALVQLTVRGSVGGRESDVGVLLISGHLTNGGSPLRCAKAYGAYKGR